MSDKSSKNQLNRRMVIKSSLIGLGATAILGVKGVAETVISDSVLAINKSFAGDKGDQLDPATVQEFVRLSHFDYDSVAKMVSIQPELVSASWDWGGGDFETGLGAASHVGNKRIALLLLKRGARPDIFTMAMLGNLEGVKSLITMYPYLKDCKGPHGLTLIHHAQKGGNEASEVLTYLESL